MIIANGGAAQLGFGFEPAAVEVVVPAPGDGPGNWAGAASVLLVDGVYWLAWRERRPLTAGRGVAVIIARSLDGVQVEQVARIGRELFGAESLERPALLALPNGGWRLYVSCATPDSKHWWIDSLTAPTPQQLPSGARTIALPGDARIAVKDPVVWRHADEWRMFVCCHPLADPGDEDRMTTRLATSTDGLDWTDGGEMLCGTMGSWDARGARVTAVVPGARIDGMPELVLYDGRPDAASNWHETTGLARWDGARYRSVSGIRWQSAHSDTALRSGTALRSATALRYACVISLSSGGVRCYAELARPDSAHDLVSWLTEF